MSALLAQRALYIRTRPDPIMCIGKIAQSSSQGHAGMAGALAADTGPVAQRQPPVDKWFTASTRYACTLP